MHYQLLDTGNRQKLEQAGPYRLIRPALNAFWAPSLPDSEWKKADAVYRRDSSGGGAWQYRNRLPEQWSLEWGTYTLTVKPTGFGHLGFFAEQYANWAWFRQLIPTMGDAVRTLNLFGYSGVGAMAMAEAGARVTHLDAARGKVRRNVPEHVPHAKADAHLTQRVCPCGRAHRRLPLRPVAGLPLLFGRAVLRARLLAGAFV